MQELGPNQTRWVEALESGYYAQGKCALNDNGRFCCLGVACEIFKTDETPIETSASGITLYDGQGGNAPDYVMDKLGLYDRRGKLQGKPETLARINDSGASFISIAEIIRKNPEQVFKEPL